VRLLVDTLDQVVVIPTPAVQRGPNGTFAYVLQADDRVAVRPIAVAHQLEAQAVITRGVQAGDRVVTTGFSRLKDGSSVSVAAPEGQPPAADNPASISAKPQSRGTGFRAACAADIQKLCPNVERGRDIRACLQSNAQQLSEPCKAAAKALSAQRSEDGGAARDGPMRKADAKQ
jgi:hypothetical protein